MFRSNYLSFLRWTLRPQRFSSKHTVRFSHSSTSQSVETPLVLQLWGANTGVGKTVLAAGLLRTINAPSLYLKPVQTGYPEDNDAAIVQTHATQACGVTLQTFGPPLSPDLAAELEGIESTTDDVLRDQTIYSVNHFKQALKQIECSAKTMALVETAGGVLSPAPSGTVQADLYRPFRFPALLLGDSKLGGISTTLAAFEALHIRGYDVPAIIFFPIEESELENESSVEKHVAKYGSSVFRAPALPPQEVSLTEYFQSSETIEFFTKLEEHLRLEDSTRYSRLREMHQESKNVFWYPFTQHKTLDRITSVDSASDNNFTCYDPVHGLHEVVDGSGSWWTNGVGHGNAEITKAAANACGRYGHVMFPEATNKPAFELAKLLLNGPGKGWATRVFYSDNGSTAVEVALKMAFRKRAVEFPERRGMPVLMVGMDGCYHGDTLGVMDCAPSSDFNRSQTPWYEPRGIFFEPPTAAIERGTWRIQMPQWTGMEYDIILDGKAELLDPSRSLAQYHSAIASRLDQALNSGHELGALLIEPVLMGAGGMQLVDPAFQRALIMECQQRSIPVIFDEVFTGLWRLGTETGAEILGISPDIAAYGKLLTGGTIPLSATLATKEVFDAFDGNSKVEALLHGHSYTAHPMGCAAGIESFRQYSNMEKNRNYWNEDFVRELSCVDGVSSATTIGTLLAVCLQAEQEGYAATGAKTVVESLAADGIFARPLGNVVYILCTPLTSSKKCSDIAQKLHKALRTHENLVRGSATG